MCERERIQLPIGAISTVFLLYITADTERERERERGRQNVRENERETSSPVVGTMVLTYPDLE